MMRKKYKLIFEEDDDHDDFNDDNKSPKNKKSWGEIKNESLTSHLHYLIT